MPQPPAKRRSPWVRLLKQGVILFLTVVFLGLSVLGFFYFNAHKDAEEAMNDLQQRIDGVNKPTTVMMSRDGVVLFSDSAENRIPLKLNEIPKFVQNAVIAAEDRRFYQHTGVDMTSMARMLFVDMRSRRLAQGGSTITMQLVKLLFNGSSRTFRRKMNDIAYAQVMEQRLPKDRILELYLNKVFFGEGAYGIGEAARTYFDKNISQLTLGEAAMLARCIRRPSSENPIRDLPTALNNRDVVLGIMRDENMISEEQYDKAVAEKPKINAKPPNAGIYVKPGVEHFVDHVREFIERDLGLDLRDGGYTIQTTLDWGIQREAVADVRAIVDENRELRVNQGAFMVMNSNGEILAEVGALNYRRHQQNIITQGNPQPGSGFKPIVYAVALRDGVINMDSMLSNAPIYEKDPITGKVWTPGNASRSENAPSYSLRTALALSVNRCAIHTIQEVGPRNVVQAAYDCFGFRSKLDPYEPLALGASSVAPIEMAEAYSVFMLRGNRVRPQPVIRITDPDGNLIKEYQPQVFSGVFDPNVCDEMDQLLRGVVEHGTGTEALIVPDARGKTGTTNDARDAWFTGYAHGLLGVGWVGHERLVNGIWKRTPMSNSVYGGTVTAKIWARIMKVACAKYGSSTPPPAPPVETASKPKPTDQQAEQGVDPDVEATPDDSKTPPTKTQPDEASGTQTAASGDAGGSGTAVNPGDVKSGTPDSKGTSAATDKGNTPPPPGDTTVDSKPPRPARTPKREDKSDTVTVEICQDSGLIANPYCPETVTRTFKRGKEPKRVCRIHGPGN